MLHFIAKIVKFVGNAVKLDYGVIHQRDSPLLVTMVTTVQTHATF